MFIRTTRLFLLILFLHLVHHPAAHCTSSDPQNLGARSLGMGGAVVALADDLMSALYTNPAGLVQLEGVNMAVGSALSFNNTRYKSADGRYDEENYYVGNVPYGGYASKVSDKYAVGIGLFSTLGNGYKFRDYNAGGVRGELKNVGGVLSLAPTISYLVHPKLLLGLQLQVGYAISEMALPTPAGYLDTEANGFGVAPVVGLLYKPTSFFNVGIKWKGPMKTALAGDADLTTIGGQKIYDSLNVDFYWPQMVEFGVAYKFRHDFVISVYGKWTDWPSFEKSNLQFENMASFNTKVISDMRDGIRWGIGAEYKPKPNLSLRCGYLRDLYSAEANSLSPFLVDLSFDTFSLGGGINFGKLKVEASLFYLSYHSRESAGAYPGNYSGDGIVPSLEISYLF